MLQSRKKYKRSPPQIEEHSLLLNATIIGSGLRKTDPKTTSPILFELPDFNLRLFSNPEIVILQRYFNTYTSYKIFISQSIILIDPYYEQGQMMTEAIINTFKRVINNAGLKIVINTRGDIISATYKKQFKLVEYTNTITFNIVPKLVSYTDIERSYLLPAIMNINTLSQIFDYTGKVLAGINTFNYIAENLLILPSSQDFNIQHNVANPPIRFIPTGKAVFCFDINNGIYKCHLSNFKHMYFELPALKQLMELIENYTFTISGFKIRELRFSDLEYSQFIDMVKLMYGEATYMLYMRDILHYIKQSSMDINRIANAIVNHILNIINMTEKTYALNSALFEGLNRHDLRYHLNTNLEFYNKYTNKLTKLSVIIDDYLKSYNVA